MLNLSLGWTVERDGLKGIQTNRKANGHAIYGPYAMVEPGRYQVAFDILPAAKFIDTQLVVAFVDVVSDNGKSMIALDYVTSGQVLAGEPIVLDFDLAEARILEFRVRVMGAAELFIGDDPRLSRRGSEPAVSRLAANDDARLAADALKLGLRLEDILEMSGPSPEDNEQKMGGILRSCFADLRPQAVAGHRKIRLGSAHDGGYICIDDFDGIDTVLSLGINDNVDFDDAVAQLGATVYQFDHTVDAPRPRDPRMIFEKKMIGVDREDYVETLSALIRRHDRGETKPNIFLKIDIEDWEWPVFDVTEDRDLRRVRQITGELHGFEFFHYKPWWQRTQRVLKKLSKQFALVHVHANNSAAITSIDNMLLPNVLEMTFVNRDVYRIAPSNERFPAALDTPCDPRQPEIALGAFSF